MTLAQLVAIALSYVLDLEPLRHAVLGYGSPVTIIYHTLGFDADQPAGMYLPFALLYHGIKYLLLCRAQFTAEWRSFFYLTIMLEMIYLLLCWHYL
jgi:hypothetical protein